MSEASPTNEPTDETEPSSSGPARVLRTAANIAGHLRRVVGRLALSSALAAIVVAGMLWWPPSIAVSSGVGFGLTLALLLSPAAVLGVFYAALRQLVALPNQFAEQLSETATASSNAYHAAVDRSSHWLGRLRRFARELWSLRSLVAEHRALLVRYGLSLRVLTPAFLLLVAAAAVAALLLIGGAVVAVLIGLLV